MIDLDLPTPEWAEPLLEPSRYKGAKGGRGSGKSHFFAELLVEEHCLNPDQQSVCIREVQKSLKFSAKKLIEDKISALGVSDLFEITQTEIRRKGAKGLIIFQGMQDHTADSIKSLEGFDRAWVEEAQNLSDRSLRLLRPTIRKEGSEIWFSWNPEQPTDAVDQFLCVNPPDDAIVVHANYDQNPFLPEPLRKEMEHDAKHNPDSFGHVWRGEYNTRSDEQVLSGKWSVYAFDPEAHWDGPYYGLDFGFAEDPTAAVECWIGDGRLWVRAEAGKAKLELDQTAKYIEEKIPGFKDYVSRADSARPESISYLKRHGMPRVEAAKKWPGSVEDGISHLRSYVEIVIHPDCKETAKEAANYKYKVDKRSGDITPEIIDKYNHYWDAVRYALGPMIKQSSDTVLVMSV